MKKRQREILKVIKPLVDKGARGRMMRIYQNLTTNRKRAPKCLVCDGPIVRTNGRAFPRFDSSLCFQIYKRKNHGIKKLLALFTLSLLAGLVFATPSPNTGQITLAWSYDFQANPGVTNFVIYIGRTTGTYTNTYNVGTNLQTTISGLLRGATYYAAATAQSNAGLESDYSNEASNTIANKPPKPQAFTAQ